MAQAAGAVAAAAAAYRPEPQSVVRVTATASVAMFLSLHAGELARAADPAEIALIPTRRKLDLATGEADIALRMRHLSDAADLVARKLGRMAFAMYEAPTGASGAVIGSPEDPDLSRQAAFIANFARERVVVARIGDMPVRYQAAKAGLGAAFLPCWLGDSDPALVCVPEPGNELVEDVFLVRHSRSRRRTPVLNVANAVVVLFRAQARLLDGTSPQGRR